MQGTAIIQRNLILGSEERCNNHALRLIWSNLIPVHNMNAHSGLEVYLHSFLKSAISGSEWSSSCVGRFTRKGPLVRSNSNARDVGWPPVSVLTLWKRKISRSCSEFNHNSAYIHCKISQQGRHTISMLSSLSTIFGAVQLWCNWREQWCMLYRVWCASDLIFAFKNVMCFSFF
jgi:hypothetical protein